MRAANIEASSSFDGRWRWLGHPAFLCAVFVLALNDHVLKGRFPGWWTGKLSDFAGVAVVATTAAVLVGAKRGAFAAGVGFVAIKVLPGVAEMSAPILGGVPRRDTSDLIALLILVPWWFLTRSGAPTPSSALRSRTPRSRAREVITRCLAAIAAGLPVAGAVAAVVTTTATSCSPTPAVTEVRSLGDNFYAVVNHGWGEPEWAQSDDGGRSWSKSAGPPGAGSISRPRDAYEDPGPSGPLEACSSDGNCWRIRDRRSIERRLPNGGWVEEVLLTDAEYSEISTGCAGAHVGVLGSIAVVDRGADSQVVASLGADGVLVRGSEGEWTRQRVLSAPPVDASPTEATASTALLAYGPIAAIALWLLGRRRLPSWRAGLAAIGIGWFGTIMASGAIGFMAGPGTDPTRIIGRVGLAGMVVTTVAAIVVARRPRQGRRLPPPPMPLPPLSPGQSDGTGR